MPLFELLVSLAMASPVGRITSISKDLSKSDLIHVSPGLATVVEFPKPIIEVRVGNPGILKTSISSVSPNELSLFLGKENVGPTNLIVRSDRRVYVFDIVPSRSIHQDFIRVSSAFGSPVVVDNLRGYELLNITEGIERNNGRQVLLHSSALGGGK